MIFLHTGLPGGGKTLFSLYHIKKLAEKESRQVYYFNITDLNIPEWIELTEDQVLKWFDLPAGSIILIDECQRIFRPRPSSSKVPDHVERLETHRHQGHDLYLITQHPGLIDLNVRKLVGTHRHLVRAFGTKHAVIHEWNQCKDNCDKSRKDSIKTQFKYPKEVFTWYKSAEVHTHRVKIPWRIVFLVLAPFIILGGGYYAYRGLTVGGVERAKAAVSKAQGHEDGFEGHVSTPGSSPGSSQPRPITTKEYLDSYKPRVSGLPHTAPRYDAITVPVEAPYPVGCYTISKRCKCVTQQGTELKTDYDFCINVVKNGFFKDWGEGHQSVSSDQGV